LISSLLILSLLVVVETSHSTSTHNPGIHFQLNSPATRLGIYGSYRLIPGLTTLTCKCAEKDTELLGLKSKHEEAITALTKGHADIISHLTAEFQEKLTVHTETHEKEKQALTNLVQHELENRLDSAFRFLDSSWTKQRKLIEQEYSSLINTLRSENGGLKGQLAAEKTRLDEREKLVAAREHDVKASKKALSKNVQKRRSELEKSRGKLLKLQTVLSLVSEYQTDCMLMTQHQASQYYEDAQEQAQVNMTLAQQEAQSIVEVAQARAEEILQQAQAAAESIFAETQRQSEALSWEGSRRSPTLSDASSSVYSLRSFESLPILEESHGEQSTDSHEHGSRTPNSISRRSSFSGTKKRSSAMRRRPSKSSFVTGIVEIAYRTSFSTIR
jgi:hypothetical protein